MDKPKKNPRIKFYWIAGAIIISIIWIALLLSYFTENLTGRLTAIWMIVPAVIFVLGLGGYQYFNGREPSQAIQIDDKLPNAITERDAHERAILKLKGIQYFDYIEDPPLYAGTMSIKGEHITTSVYLLYGRGLNRNKYYVVAINMHYPDQRALVTVSDKEYDDYALQRVARGVSTDFRVTAKREKEIYDEVGRLTGKITEDLPQQETPKPKKEGDLR